MIRRIVFALLLALQFAAVTSVATAISPMPRCGPCPTQSGR
jgi:hypothetical protein